MHIERFLLAAILALPCGAVDLIRDDFSRYPAGWLTEPIGLLNPAIQEYHYLPHRGVPLGPWENAICHLDAWLAGDEQGKPFLEQHLVKNAGMQYTTPLFITGDPEWGDYTVEVKVKPLALEDMAGIVFRYHTNRHYYLFALTGGNRARLSLRLPIEKTFRVSDWKELASVPFVYDATRYYTLRVENEGPRMRAYIDGKLVAEASDSEILKGKAGLSAEAPARYQDFRASVTPAAGKAIQARIRAREAELARLRDANPQPKLWKKFQTPVFGAGRNARFGRPGRRRRPRDADRPERLALSRQRRLDHSQLPHRGQLRRQSALAVRQAQSAQRPAHQRHGLSDSRCGRRWPQ